MFLHMLMIISSSWGSFDSLMFMSNDGLNPLIMMLFAVAVDCAIKPIIVVNGSPFRRTFI